MVAEKTGVQRAGLDVVIDNAGYIPLKVQLTCAPGELLALTGPSGGGKTTVLRTIAGLHRVAAGNTRICCNGAVWVDAASGVSLTTQQRRIGMVFQQYALVPHLSALDNVGLSLLDRPVRQRRTEAADWLMRTNMQGLEQRLPSELSGGQRQRVALARALARQPQALLLDEPFSAVDTQTRQILYRELANLRRQLNIPMLLVTHDLAEVQQLADSLCLVHKGQSLTSGLVDDVLRCPESTTAARLLGHRNLFDGQVVHRTGLRLKVALGSATLDVLPQTPVASDNVTVLISPASVVLHRRDKPSRGERENPLAGTVVEATVLGDDVNIALRLDANEKPLQFRLSRHVAARNGIAVGTAIVISVLGEAVHLIPR